MAIEIDKTRTASSNADKRSALTLDKAFRFGGGPSPRDRMFFTEQLALLLDTGESLHTALQIIARQHGDSAMGQIIETIANDVSQGSSFGAALSHHPDVFSLTYTNLIAASEKGGFMADVLERLLDMDRRREDLRNTIVSAATYPVFLSLFSLAVIVFVLVVVFPKFDSMFAAIYDELPASTRVLMAVSHAMRDHWVVICAGIGVAVVGVHQWITSDAGGRQLDTLKLKSPWIGKLFADIYLTQILPVLGLSLANGVTAVDALRSSRDVVGNRLFRELVHDVKTRVESGESIATGFDDASFLPELVKHMVGTGEKSGKLGPVLLRLSVYYEAELRRRLDTLSKMAEPIMLLIMGIVVGILVSSLILPIFKLSTAAG